MKILIVFVAIIYAALAAVNLDDCLNQAKNFKTCFEGKLKDGAANLKPDFDSCFEIDGVKGICQKPEFKKPTVSGAVATEDADTADGADGVSAARIPQAPKFRKFTGTPNPEWKQQFQAVLESKKACMTKFAGQFKTCIANKLQIKESDIDEFVKNHNLSADSHGAPGQGGFGGFGGKHGGPGGGFMPSPEEIDSFLSKSCNGNAAAIDALKKCGTEKFKAVKTSICGFVKDCNTISQECQDELKKDIKAGCACKNETMEALKADSSCTGNDHHKEAAASTPTGGRVGDHHHFAHHKHLKFDICKFIDKDICADDSQ